MRRLPCTWIDIDDDSAPVLLQKSNSLFHYVGVEDDVDENFVKNLKGLTLNFRAPIRILLIMLNRKNCSTGSYLDLLEQFWQEQLVDVTIIGISSRVSEPRRKITIVNQKLDYTTTIHHYNPFTRFYTNRDLNSSNLLFPTKLSDLHGHKLRLGFKENPLQSLHSRESQKIEAFVDELLSTIQRKLNFSVELDLIPISDVSHLLYNDSISDAVQEIISLRHLDVYASGAHLTYNEQPFPVRSK
ncbi:unnamed protein product [Trichogramma brassicae]|uniref:Uncharacterized protein n=1 Tax=Trichogramma brassicae TaxID=86971 RepID=A0A6H5ICL0_9HYME|nr:unnamed protein product [Trichogramma brassicae]